VPTLAEVTKINLTPDGKHATGLTYVDAQGDETEQPASPRLNAETQFLI
jgi:gluconate 2-dehydrogenase alpha chain